MKILNDLSYLYRKFRDNFNHPYIRNRLKESKLLSFNKLCSSLDILEDMNEAISFILNNYNKLNKYVLYTSLSQTVYIIYDATRSIISALSLNDIDTAMKGNDKLNEFLRIRTYINHPTHVVEEKSKPVKTIHIIQIQSNNDFITFMIYSEEENVYPEIITVNIKDLHIEALTEIFNLLTKINNYFIEEIKKYNSNQTMDSILSEMIEDRNLSNLKDYINKYQKANYQWRFETELDYFFQKLIKILDCFNSLGSNKFEWIIDIYTYDFYLPQYYENCNIVDHWNYKFKSGFSTFSNINKIYSYAREKYLLKQDGIQDWGEKTVLEIIKQVQTPYNYIDEFIELIISNRKLDQLLEVVEFVVENIEIINNLKELYLKVI